MDQLYEEKISQLSRVDGNESLNEINFINSVADRLQISREDLQKIRKNLTEVAFNPPTDMYQIMMQYHRLIVLMGIDRIIAKEEKDFCMELGMKMNLLVFTVQVNAAIAFVQ